MKKIKRKYIIGGILILVAVGFFMLSRRGRGVVTASPVKVETLKVQKSVSASGKVTSASEVDLGFVSSGVLKSINAEKGQHYEKGYTLANIVNYEEFQNSESKRLLRDVALSDRKVFVEDYADNVDAIGGADEYYLRLARLDELIAKAEADYQISLGALADTYLKAPFDGTVIDIFIEENEVATAGETLIKFADLDNLIFEISVDQEDFGYLQLGQNVDITLDAFDDVVFSGVVTELPNFVDTSSTEFVVKIKIQPVEGKKVLLGMEGDADIIIESTDAEVAALPFDTVLSDDQGDFVWYVDKGVLKKMYVETGLEGDVYTEIKTDVSTLQIVSPEGENIKEGSKVKLQES